MERKNQYFGTHLTPRLPASPHRGYPHRPFPSPSSSLSIFPFVLSQYRTVLTLLASVHPLPHLHYHPLPRLHYHPLAHFHLQFHLHSLGLQLHFQVSLADGFPFSQRCVFDFATSWHLGFFNCHLLKCFFSPQSFFFLFFKKKDLLGAFLEPHFTLLLDLFWRIALLYFQVGRTFYHFPSNKKKQKNKKRKEKKRKEKKRKEKKRKTSLLIFISPSFPFPSLLQISNSNALHLWCLLERIQK